MTAKIITSHIYPPIPTRNCDWCAYRDGTEERGNYGYGRSEQDAIDDLHRIETEELEFQLETQMRAAENGNDWAEVCRLESELEALR